MSINKKGFTLIEVISIIFMISVLTVLLLPTILNNVNSKKEDISNLEKEIIYDATQLYIEENDYYFSGKNVGDTYCIDIETLIEEKKLSKPLIDVKTKKEIPLNSSIKVTVENGNSYNYEIMENKNCEESLKN